MLIFASWLLTTDFSSGHWRILTHGLKAKNGLTGALFTERMVKQTISGWWFGTWLLFFHTRYVLLWFSRRFPYMRGRSTINQICYVCIWRCGGNLAARQQAGWDGESWAWHSSLAPTILAGGWISTEKMVGVTYLKQKKKRNSKNAGSKKIVLPYLKHHLTYF